MFPYIYFQSVRNVQHSCICTASWWLHGGGTSISKHGSETRVGLAALMLAPSGYYHWHHVPAAGCSRRQTVLAGARGPGVQQTFWDDRRVSGARWPAGGWIQRMRTLSLSWCVIGTAFAGYKLCFTVVRNIIVVAIMTTYVKISSVM